MQKRIYEPLAGEHIDNAIEESLKLSLKYLSPVEFSFNDIVIIVNAPFNNTVSFYAEEYRAKQKKRTEEYRKSEEFKKQQEKDLVRLLKDQEAMNSLMAELSTIGDCFESKAIEWFINFIPLSDKVDVEYNKDVLIMYLYEQSIFPSMYVGFEGTWTRDKKLAWVYGQVLEGLINYGLVHPIFSDKLKELK